MDLVLDLRDDLTDSDIAAVGRDYGLTLHDNSIFSKELDKIELASISGLDVAALLARMRGDARIEHAELQSYAFASFVPNDPLYAEKQWHIKRVGAEEAWNMGCGRGVTVAVIDTGVACFDKGPFSRGTDLSGTRCTGGYNFVNDTPQAADDHGHGTHVAGTIAQTTNNGKGAAGLAYCATLMPIKVLSGRGYGSLSDVAEGIRFAAKNGAQVINMSLGGRGSSPVLASAVKYAIDRGVIVIAAAGNNGRTVEYPGAYPGVIAVSATDSNDRIAWFSSRGKEVFIAAPGVAVTQQTVCNGGRDRCEIFGTFNGTSMAAPHVAGAAALLVGAGVTNADKVASALASSARTQSNTEHFGAGILNVSSALRSVFWQHFGLRLAALAALAIWVRNRIRKQRGKGVLGFGPLVAAFASGVGLLFVVPLLGFLPRAGAIAPVLEVLSRPVGEWSFFLSPSLHKFLPLASAIPTFALAALGFGTRARSLIGGFALGSAALLVQLAISADVATVYGSFGLRLFAIVNALACIWVARHGLDAKAA